jgi:hypothetical protein
VIEFQLGVIKVNWEEKEKKKKKKGFLWRGFGNG